MSWNARSATGQLRGVEQVASAGLPLSCHPCIPELIWQTVIERLFCGRNCTCSWDRRNFKVRPERLTGKQK